MSERFTDEVHDEALYKSTFFTLLLLYILWRATAGKEAQCSIYIYTEGVKVPRKTKNEGPNLAVRGQKFTPCSDRLFHVSLRR